MADTLQKILMIVGVLALSAGIAVAQTSYGSLYGTVVDEQGAALPGVTVTLTGPGAPMVQVTTQEIVSPRVFRVGARLSFR